MDRTHLRTRPHCSRCDGLIPLYRGPNTEFCSVRCETPPGLPPIGERRSPREVIASTCEGTGLTPADIASKSREARIVEVRSRAMRALRRETTLSLPRIGKIVGGFDHTTVLHALRKADKPLGDMPIPRGVPKCCPISTRPKAVVVLLSSPVVVSEARAPASPKSDEGDKLTAEQLACSRATEELRAALGADSYSRFNKSERSQLRSPAWF